MTWFLLLIRSKNLFDVSHSYLDYSNCAFLAEARFTLKRKLIYQVVMNTITLILRDRRCGTVLIPLANMLENVSVP